MAAPLSTADRSRLEKIIGMLSSSFEPERLVALKKIQNIADEYKVPIHELLLGAASAGQGSSYDRQRAEEAERRAREAEFRAQRAERAARKTTQNTRPDEPAPEMPALPPGWWNHFKDAAENNRTRRFLTAWETTFVSDLIERGTRWPSPKQAAVILRILEKAAVFRGQTSDAAEDWEDVR